MPPPASRGPMLRIEWVRNDAFSVFRPSPTTATRMATSGITATPKQP